MPQIIKTAETPSALQTMISLWDPVCSLQNDPSYARYQLLRPRAVNNTVPYCLSHRRSSLWFTPFMEQLCFFTLRNSTDYISKFVWGPWGLA